MLRLYKVFRWSKNKLQTINYEAGKEILVDEFG